MLNVRKFSHKGSGLPNNAGQAVIEYVLLLIITIGLLTALSTKIIKPFGKFIESYMGSYVQCILETGELPSLGGDSTALADEGCNSKFEDASLANGRPPIGGTPGAGVPGLAASGSQGNSASSRPGGGYAGSASRSGSRFLSSAGGGSPASESRAGDNSKETEIALAQSGSGSSFLSSGSGTVTVIRRRQRSIPVNMQGLSVADQEQLKKKAEDGKKEEKIVIGDSNTRGPKKILLKKPTEVLAMPEDEPVSFGNFMRIIFIAAIIIVLVVLIGGQALQMSKNFEK